MDRLTAMAVFVRVAECGSFSRAAEAMDLANATVTTCVRNLERHLTVTLIDRDTRRLHLTEAGVDFLKRARQILAALEEAENEAQLHAGQLRGPLVIETPISIGHAVLCPALPRFAARHPAISTTVTLTNQPHNLIEKAIDVAIRMDHVEDADLVARPIYEARYVVCARPDQAARLPAHPGGIDPALCLGLQPEERRTLNPWRLERPGETPVTIQPAGPLHFNTSGGLLTAAEEGAGIIHVLDVFARRALKTGDLVQVYPEWTTPAKTFYAVMTKPRSASAKVRAFIEFLVEVLDPERRPNPARAVEVRALLGR